VSLYRCSRLRLCIKTHARQHECPMNIRPKQLSYLPSFFGSIMPEHMVSPIPEASFSLPPEFFQALVAAAVVTVKMIPYGFFL